MEIRTKRIYDEPSDEDGHRVLVDRLWPRGFTKERARLDDWAKDLAPSHELRKWYKQGDQSFEAFAARYRAELESLDDAIVAFVQRLPAERITLLYATKDDACNHAVILKHVLEQKLSDA